MALNKFSGGQVKSGTADGIGVDEFGNLRVNTGLGLHIVDDAVIPKLDGNSLVIGADGIKVNLDYINKHIDGGRADSIYTINQRIRGGRADG